MIIASKKCDIVPIEIEECASKLCHGRFSLRRFLRRESEIIFALNFDLETPNALEFLTFYFKVVKFMI